MIMPVPHKADPPLEVVFAALADRTRLRLLNLMSGGEVCVCFFVEVLDEPQPKVSRHLAYLRRAGLVHARRDGKWIHYGIAPDLPKAAQQILDAALQSFSEDPSMRADYVAFARSCCSPKSLPEQLQRAPRPLVTERRS